MPGVAVIQKSSRRFAPVGWALLAACALLGAGVGLPLTDGDSALYAVVARDALARGQWVAYTFRDGRVFDKPPLTVWLLQISIAAFGSAEWAVRLWHLLLALATAGATYRLARLTLPAAQSALAALVLLTSAQFFYQALVPQQDVPLTLFVALAIDGYLRWERDGTLAAGLLAGAAAGLAVLSKGLVGVLLPVLVVGVRLAVDRPHLPARWPAGLAAAAGACLLVAAPWFVAAGLRQGRDFVDTFVLGGPLGVARFFRPALSAPERIPGVAGLFAYVLFLPLGLLPWTGWLWPALREGSRARDDRVLRVCFLWVASILVFLSVAPGDKVIRYLLPVFPAAAVLLAHAVSDVRWDRPASTTAAVGAGLLVAAAAAVGVAAPAEVAPFRPVAVAVLLPMAGALAAGSVFLRARRKPQATAAIVALVLGGYGLLLVATARQWDRISPWRPVARMVNAAAHDAPVLVEGEPTPFADFYIHRPVEYVSRDELLKRWRTGRVIAVVPEQSLAALPSPGPVILGRAPAGVLVVRNF